MDADARGAIRQSWLIDGGPDKRARAATYNSRPLRLAKQ